MASVAATAKDDDVKWIVFWAVLLFLVTTIFMDSTFETLWAFIHSLTQSISFLLLFFFWFSSEINDIFPHWVFFCCTVMYKMSFIWCALLYFAIKIPIHKYKTQAHKLILFQKNTHTEIWHDKLYEFINFFGYLCYTFDALSLFTYLLFANSFG